MQPITAARRLILVLLRDSKGISSVFYCYSITALTVQLSLFSFINLLLETALDSSFVLTMDHMITCMWGGSVLERILTHLSSFVPFCCFQQQGSNKLCPPACLAGLYLIFFSIFLLWGVI